MSFPAYWTDEGIVAHVPAFAGLGQGLRGERVVRARFAAGAALRPSQGMDPRSPEAVAVPWSELSRLEAVEPWPRFRLVWLWKRGGSDSATFAPGRRALRRAFAERVERMIEHAARHAPEAVARGWLEVPVVDWELLSALPPFEAWSARQGAYRSADLSPPERIVADRDTPAPFETLLQWLASTPDRPFSEHPRRILVTDAHVYALRRDRRWQRVPASALRLRRGAPDEDGVYVFGRHTELILPHRDDCPVERALDEALTTSNRSRSPK